MRRIQLISAILFMLLTGSLFAQQQLVTQTPEKPKAGDNVKITYNGTLATATLKHARPITLYVLCFDYQNNMKIKEFETTNNYDLCSASFKLENEVFFTYYFDDSIAAEYNNGEAWYSMVYNSKGQPVTGANYTMGMLYNYSGFMEFILNKSKEKSIEYLNKEIAANPGHVPANSMKWNAMMREKSGDETTAIIKKELDKVYNLNKNDEEAVYRLLMWFERTKQTAKVEEIKNAFTKKNPKGYIARMISLEALYNEKDAQKRIENSKKMLVDFPDLKEQDKNNINSIMLSAYVENKDYQGASSLMKTLKTISSGEYNEIAWSLIEKGEQLEQAVKWANEGMKLAENPDISTKPAYASTKNWKIQSQQSVGMISDTYAFGLYKLGYTVAAESQYEKSFILTKANTEDINARYAECLVVNGNYAKAVEVSEECLLKGKANSDLLKNYKIAWLKLGRNEQEFDSKIAQLNSNAKAESLTKLKGEMINKPAIDFTLKSLDGKTVKLSDLKGKIVVVDFWATWCGPCIASFPGLQKIYDKYKDNPNIIILALDTWERVAGDEKTTKVKEFIEKNKYTFTVLFDEDFVSKYEVTGIPTKFIIDRYGKIQFKTIGFDGEAQMIADLEAEFEILLNDDYLKDLK